MASNLKVDIVKPTATNGSLSLKGDSGGSATSNGISVDSSGDTSITGTTTIATADINGGTIDGTTIGGTTPAAGSFTSVDATSASLDGAVTINESGADVDFRVESDTKTHALFVQGSDGRVGVNTNNPSHELTVNGSLALSDAGTAARNIEIGSGRTGDNYSFIDLIGDTTYSDYGLRIVRNNTGANTSSALYHRGTGELQLIAVDSGSVSVHTSNTERMRIDSSGILQTDSITNLAGTGAPDFPNGLTGLVFSKTSTSAIYVHSGSGSAANVYEEIHSSFNFSISLSAGTTILVMGSAGEFFSDSGRCFFKYEISDGTTTTIVENATYTTNQTMTVSAQLKHTVGGSGTKTVTGKAYYKGSAAGASVYFDNRATVAGPFCVSLLKYTESL